MTPVITTNNSSHPALTAVRSRGSRRAAPCAAAQSSTQQSIPLTAKLSGIARKHNLTKAALQQYDGADTRESRESGAHASQPQKDACDEAAELVLRSRHSSASSCCESGVEPTRSPDGLAASGPRPGARTPGPAVAVGSRSPPATAELLAGVGRAPHEGQPAESTAPHSVQKRRSGGCRGCRTGSASRIVSQALSITPLFHCRTSRRSGIGALISAKPGILGLTSFGAAARDPLPGLAVTSRYKNRHREAKPAARKPRVPGAQLLTLCL